MANSSTQKESGLKGSAIDGKIQDFVDSTGGFVTDALCEALVEDLLPKNLVSQVIGVVKPETDARTDRKHAGSRKRSDLLSEDAICERVIRLFPGAAKSGKLRKHVLSLLREEGMVDSNTLFATCQCPEDSHYIFKDCGVAGECFALGGLGGLPALGRTGIELVLKARPAGGRVLLIYGPHIGIDDCGKLGKTQRMDYKSDSRRELNACDTCIAAYEQQAKSPSAPFEASAYRDDYQRGRVQEVVALDFQSLASSSNPHRKLAHVMFDNIERELMQLTSKVGGICFLGGISINTPDECDEYFLPLRFAVRNSTMKTHGLLEKLAAQMQRCGDLKLPDKTEIELGGDAWRHGSMKEGYIEETKETAASNGENIWEEHTDESSGKPYWYNTETGEMRWKEEEEVS